ncbi:MAG: hypothetical protein BWX48_00022 [Verrucomicrobia bacterium ADurb.Bin006]|nr:MAG: hypothetical protein BWX48_00022 [Verrucomicrobia bacterium ADurb.Bin006]
MQLSPIKQVCEADPAIRLSILFGSLNGASPRFDSDLDLAVAEQGPMDSRRKQALIEDLAVASGRSVDLVDLHTAHGLLLRSILGTGRMLVCRDRNLYATLIRRMLFEQADFSPLVRRIHACRAAARTKPPTHRRTDAPTHRHRGP